MTEPVNEGVSEGTGDFAGIWIRYTLHLRWLPAVCFHPSKELVGSEGAGQRVSSKLNLLLRHRGFHELLNFFYKLHIRHIRIADNYRTG